MKWHYRVLIGRWESTSRADRMLLWRVPAQCATTMDGGSARIAGANYGLVDKSLAFGSRHPFPDYQASAGTDYFFRVYDRF